MPENYRLDRGALEVGSLKDKPNDRQYWMSKTPKNASKPSNCCVKSPMATIRLPRDFKEFLKLLNSKFAEYLIIAGYAVDYYGYARSTGDMDIWIARSPENFRVAEALSEFGFPAATPAIFDAPDRMVRMGVPPLRLEILTSISGVEFADCFARRGCADVDGVPVPIIALDDLKRNKHASGRAKDLADLEELD